MEQSLVLGVLALAAIAVVGPSIRRWARAHAARRSMSNYLEAVLADLGTLSIKTTGARATTPVIPGRRVVRADVHPDAATVPSADHTVAVSSCASAVTR
jgi:hypothetical protein